jgi:hypothetical protein
MYITGELMLLARMLANLNVARHCCGGVFCAVQERYIENAFLSDPRCTLQGLRWRPVPCNC